MNPSNIRTDGKSVIVVGVDFSEVSRDVLRMAASLASGPPSEVHVVHVLPLPPGQTLGASRADRELKFADKLDTARAAIHELCADIVRLGKRVRAHLRVGSPDVEIAQLATDLHADLVVVGTHGYKGLDRLLLGSVAESLVRHAPCPVLAYRAKVIEPWDQIEPPCPDCVAIQKATARAKLWCERHSQRHVRAHTYSEIPPSFGIGAQTFR
jgi:nucleotide-binding universal stress UspA family protein